MPRTLRIAALCLTATLALAGCKEEDGSQKKTSPSPASGGTPPNSALKPPPYSYSQSVLSIPSVPLNDTYYGTTGAWSNLYTDLWGFDDVNAASTFPSLTLPAQEIVVAVIDTGLDYDASDISGRMWINSGEHGGGKESNGVDDDGNGYIDDFMGWNWVHDNNHPVDDHGHGTHVAGTIAAVGGNAMGIVGVAPWVRIMPLKVCSYRGSCSSADVRAAISYAIDNGARVINISLGGPVESADSAAYESIIAQADAAGLVTSVSAGNSSADAMTSVPANATFAMTIAANASDGEICSSFSNFGYKIDVSAPGCGFNGTNEVSGILSLNSRKCGADGQDYCSTRTAADSNYSLKQGTSMAAPHVAGLAALAFTASPTASASMVRQAIRRSTQLPAGMNAGEKNIDHGFGKASATNLITEAQSAPGLKITSPKFNTTSTSHTVEFKIEARAHAVNYALSYIPYSSEDTLVLSSGAPIGAGGVVNAGNTSTVTENWAPPASGTYAVVLTATSNGQTYHDLIFLRRP